MNKNTQILLGVGALAVIGYFIYKNNKPAKANAIGRTANRFGDGEIKLNLPQIPNSECVRQECGCSTKRELVKMPDGTEEFVYTCVDGCKSFATKKENNCKSK